MQMNDPIPKTPIPKTRIAVSTNLLDNPESIPDVLDRFGPDFHIVEIELDNDARRVLEYAPAERDRLTARIRELASRHGIQLTVHGPYLGRTTDISSDDQEQRESATALMCNAIKFASEIGATRFTCRPGYLDKTRVGRTSLLENLRKSLAEMAKSAQAADLFICLENTGNERPNYIVLSDEEHTSLCDEFGIFLTLDLIHYTSFTPYDGAYYQRLDALLPLVKNIHFADMKIPKHIHLPLGCGDYAYEAVLGHIFRTKYDGNAVVEERGGKYSIDDYVDAARGFVANLNVHAAT